MLQDTSLIPIDSNNKFFMFSHGFTKNKDVLHENQNINYDLKNDTNLGFFDGKNGFALDLSKKKILFQTFIFQN